MSLVGSGLAGALAVSYVGVVLRDALARLLGSGDASLLAPLLATRTWRQCTR